MTTILKLLPIQLLIGLLFIFSCNENPLINPINISVSQNLTTEKVQILYGFIPNDIYCLKLIEGIFKIKCVCPFALLNKYIEVLKTA